MGVEPSSSIDLVDYTNISYHATTICRLGLLSWRGKFYGISNHTKTGVLADYRSKV